eukprot:1164628-Karenia_brevis.AAC.1
MCWRDDDDDDDDDVCVVVVMAVMGAVILTVGIPSACKPSNTNDINAYVAGLATAEPKRLPKFT